MLASSSSGEQSTPGVQPEDEDGRVQLAATKGGALDDNTVELHIHQHPDDLVQWLENPLQVKKSATSQTHEDAMPASTTTRPDADAPPRIMMPAPSPRLNIAIHVAGSRGDVQPFIPIAQLLAGPGYGHRVRICTHPNFKHFVESQGVEFFSIGGDAEALMAYMVKNPNLIPSRASLKAGDVARGREEMWQIMQGCWRSCIDAGEGSGDGPRQTAAPVKDPSKLFLADLIIANPPSMAHIHCAEKLGVPLHMVFTMPWSATQAFPHPLAALKYGGEDRAVVNYLSFLMVEMLTWEGLCDMINRLRMHVLHLDPVSPMWGSQLLSRLRVPYTYLWSQALVPAPKDWSPHLNITGFCQLPLASAYTPRPDLVTFLAGGPTPIYVGFGSIVVEDPVALTNTILDAVKKAGVRAIVSRGWLQLGGLDGASGDIYVIGDCPHDWLFEHVSAVVHHGGAGTTAAGIARGKPTVVVPFFGDQPFWGQMIARAGAGPVPVPRKEMTSDSLAAGILFALQPEVRQAAQAMAQVILAEDGARGAVNSISRTLEKDLVRCDVCPDRLALWEHKYTGLRLSNLAWACLVDQGRADPHEFHLFQHKHWYVDDGAKHPLVGIAAAGSSLFTGLTIAIGDYTRRLSVRPRPPADRLNKKGVESGHGAIHESSSIDNVLGDMEESITGGISCGANLDSLALEVAAKLHPTAKARNSTSKRSSSSSDKRGTAVLARYHGRRGKTKYIMRATGRCGIVMAKECLKFPTALLYNTANGFHNLAWYSHLYKMESRRRGEIDGWASGLKVAGEEIVLELRDAFSGLVAGPYLGAKEAGAKGLALGVYLGTRGFACHLGAAMFCLPGYALKGFEREATKHHLTEIQAEILLIRIRQAADELRRATLAEREQTMDTWTLKTTAFTTASTSRWWTNWSNRF